MDEIETVVILASSSPRRRELLDQIGVKYQVLHVDIDESIYEDEAATDYVVRMSLEKARRGFLSAEQRYVTIGADTCIECDGKVLGKPDDEKDAAQLLALLSDREHIVHTAVAVVDEKTEMTELCSSAVCFDKLEQSTIDAYIATGEPLDKAGAYAIQGKAAQFITKLEGSYSSVMGLPLYETARLLRKCGIKII
jgi:septum formation protein